MSYRGPVHSLEDLDTYEGLRRAAKEAGTRQIITGRELRHDIVLPLAIVAAGCGALYAIFTLLAWLVRIGVLHAL